MTDPQKFFHYDERNYQGLSEQIVTDKEIIKLLEELEEELSECLNQLLIRSIGGVRYIIPIQFNGKVLIHERQMLEVGSLNTFDNPNFGFDINGDRKVILFNYAKYRKEELTEDDVIEIMNWFGLQGL